LRQAFPRDLLIIDTESTGLIENAPRGYHTVIQLGAVLIDKSTLCEKTSFLSYVRTSKKQWARSTKSALHTHGLTFEDVEDAPTWREVTKDFKYEFSYRDYDIAGQNVKQFDIPILEQMGNGHLDWLFSFKAQDRHRVIDVWDFFICAGTFLKHPYASKYASLRNIAKHYKIPASEKHDALEDCRITAEALRRVGRDIERVI
jgi:DNA polymerase III epsilon subunit-like protein